ncbi:hypothetical protein J4573_07945 [Actinomadura barringtoniae]|uniref:Uncharacterized protein n=1 Tax=Actinomadura barringtoniae TaxID=1427535 RepID=A0A939P840_9ACTN|nr:hypothetical protein [Actinomadura barringtoniae]MBO2447017.1 hypothetical protein [Actinomadura barringtoniae]
MAEAVMALMHEGIPEEAVCGEAGAWTLRAGKYVLHFTESEFDIYLTQIELF